MKKFLFAFSLAFFISTPTFAGGPIIMSPTIDSSSGITFTDSTLIREAANHLTQRNGTSAQTWSLVNTYTSATNFERFDVIWSSNTLILQNDRGSGGGTARTMQIRTPGTDGGLGTALATFGTAVNGGLLFNASAASTANTLGRVDVGNNGGNTSTSGTSINLRVRENFAPTATSTMAARALSVEPTCNWSNGTPGAGSCTALYIDSTDTAMPTGSSYLIDARVGAAARFQVDHSGEVSFAGISGDADTAALCKKADDTIGTCSTVVGATGLCTCG